MHVDVFLEGWEIECCTPPPGEGGRVAGTVVRDVPLRGHLLAVFHGLVPDEMPLVAGTVMSVHVVEQAFRQTEPRTWERLPGEFELRRVDRSPGHFADPFDEDSDFEPSEVARWEDGVLVRLRVEGPTH